MKKLIISILILMFPLSVCHAREIVTGIENEEGNIVLTEEGIGILNEELRQQDDSIKSNATAITNINTVPSGVIVMWSGAISAIPTGWVLCDGTNGTPNLTDRFIIHADADSGGANDVGDSGGSKTISLANLPAHTHGSVGNHIHLMDNNWSIGGGGVQANSWDSRVDRESGSKYTGSAGGHTHTSVGSGSDYLPKFFALAYIMKL